MEQRVLRLPLKKEWYDMIEAGVKTEEYREIGKYWNARCTYNKDITLEELHNDPSQIREYDVALFSFGYTKRTMTFEIDRIEVGFGKKEWGATDEEMYIIKLGKRIDEPEQEHEEVSEPVVVAEQTSAPVQNIKTRYEIKKVESGQSKLTHPVQILCDTTVIESLVEKYLKKSNWAYVPGLSQVRIDTAGRINGTARVNYKPEYPVVVNTVPYVISRAKGDTFNEYLNKVNSALKDYGKGIFTIVVCTGYKVEKNSVTVYVSKISTNDKTRGLF